MAEEMVTITKKAYMVLLRESKELRRLERAGVDNWEGYSEGFEEEGDEEDEEEE